MVIESMIFCFGLFFTGSYREQNCPSIRLGYSVTSQELWLLSAVTFERRSKESLATGCTNGCIWEMVSTVIYLPWNNTRQSTLQWYDQYKLKWSSQLWASEFVLGFMCNRLSYFITVRITFTCILYPQCTHMTFIIYISWCKVYMIKIIWVNCG